MAQQKESGTTSGTKRHSAQSLLGRRVSLPGKAVKQGKLGKDVKAPGWLRRFGGYFSGAYRELRQVRWPNRRATWSMTGAVIVFTLVMAGFVLALDFGFEALFKTIIT